ncbi:MAG: bifunctional nuclease family protein [Fibrobacterota bacterium]|nr:bifunctional nuclease family protein [Fibrobacterota bacterium]
MDEEPGESFDLNEEDFLETRIDNISVSNLGFIVFLKADRDDRVLPIFIGANEAQSIAMAYNNQVLPRPLTHDLMKNVLGMLDVEVTKVQVTSLAENTFFGRVYFKKEGIEDMDIDARPSDAIALALRYKAPIFVHKDVYESASIVVKETGESEGGEPAKDFEASEPETHIDQVERLKDRLHKAVAAEHYEEAAKIRDELKKFGTGN